MAKLLLDLPDRIDMEGRIFPYLISGLYDENDGIRKKVYELIEEIGQCHEEREEEKEGSEEGEPDLIFKIKLDKPEPAGVKISKKNVCLVTIVRSDEEDKNAAS